MSHSLSFDRCLPICLLMLLAALSPVATLSYDVVLAALLVACNAAPMGRELIYYPSLPVPAYVCAFLSPVSLIASCDSFCIAVSVPCAPTLSTIISTISVLTLSAAISTFSMILRHFYLHISTFLLCYQDMKVYPSRFNR